MKNFRIAFVLWILVVAFSSFEQPKPKILIIGETRNPINIFPEKATELKAALKK
ncbi:hypothetical protein CLV33_102481 [Jejuia pallidilutea]|uniref:Uncharacterized protein n=1 Tax=Jejuia pallidilutea TaxID=504487 RepID=A0A362X2H6_9FLAO|nr:hypothetical protein [Jejuia pallidilutea]PQV50616.1 hypothetical protein CLV33_102481 [Jejuia pallidilutea]